MGQKQEIDTIIQPLFDDSPSPEVFQRLHVESIERLAALPSSYTTVLSAVAKEHFEQISQVEDSEYIFQVLIRSLVMRNNDDEAFDLAAAGLAAAALLVDFRRR